MPEAITITNQETPALSEENVEMLKAMEGQGQDDEEQLLAGKYKSVEELEKAYKELQAKLGQRQPEPTEQQLQEEADDQPEEEAEADTRSAKEIYGDFVGGRLEEAGIDFMEMNTRWQQTGELTSEDYGQLAQAGFTKEMVDAYLNGLGYQAAKDSALKAQEIADVKATVGGDQEYARMIQWAANNLSRDEIDGFNQIVNDPKASVSAIKLAVAGMQSRFQAAEGREPKLIGGRTPRTDGDVFESTAQVVEAMSNPKYQTDPAFRKKVQAKLARSNVF